MKTISFPYTDVGRTRKHNEDFLLVDEARQLYVVCDGMGGHAAGDLASKTAAHAVQRIVHERWDRIQSIARGELAFEIGAEIMREAVQTASREVYEIGRSNPEKRGMGTTCVALLIIGDKGVMANVGDSRIYLARDRQLHQLSEDHTFLREAIKAGIMTPEEAEKSAHAHVLTRACGPQSSVIVDTLVFDLLHGDTFLLCSDGLHGYFRDEAELLSRMSTEVVDDVARDLVSLANERGGHDNITAVILRTGSEKMRPGEVRRASRVRDSLETLKYIDLFREMTTAELFQVANAFEPVSYRAGSEIIIEGEISHALFVLVAGKAEVKRGHKRLAELEPGAHFGEMALLNKRPRTATVRALTDSEVLRLDRPAFYGLLQIDTALAAKFLWKLAQTLALRLDDVYDSAFAASSGDDTQVLGHLPSPFKGRR